MKRIRERGLRGVEEGEAEEGERSKGEGRRGREGDKGGEDGAKAADTVKPPFPLLLRLTPGLFIGGCTNSGAEEMNMELAAQPARPDWLTICIC